MIKVKQLTDGFPMTDEAGLSKINLEPVTLSIFFGGYWLLPVSDLL